MSNLDEQRILDALERVSQVEPAPEATAQAIERGRQVLATVSNRVPAERKRRFIHPRVVKWLIPAAAAAVVVLAVIEFRPGRPGGNVGNGIAWGDVVRQIREARTAHIHITQRGPEAGGGREIVEDFYLKAPDKSRRDRVRPEEVAESLIVNGNRQVRLIPSTKRYQAGSRDSYPSVEDVLRLCVGPPESGIAVRRDGPGSSTSLNEKLVFTGVEERGGRGLLKYCIAPANGAQPSQGDPHPVYWFDSADRTLVMVTIERVVEGGKVIETTTGTVRINVDLSDDLFSTKVPPGYKEVSELGGSPGMTAEISDVATKYEQARNAIQRYRLFTWKTSGTGTEAYSMRRYAQDGNECRVDGLYWRRIEMSSDFDAMWRQLSIDPFQDTRLTYKGQVVTIRGRGHEPRVQMWGSGGAGPTTLSELGWPMLPSSPPLKMAYQRLPDRPDRRGLIGIRAESNFGESGESLSVYWIDPAKDYLCVSYEYYSRSGQRPWQGNLDWHPTEPETATVPKRYSESDSTQEILEFGQTPDGRWYPKTVKRANTAVFDGKRLPWPASVEHVELDTVGPVSADLFEWPADVPKPK